MAAVLGRVNRHHQRRPKALGEVVAGIGDKPVVPVDEVKGIAVAELDAGGQHVGVHPLHPGDELAQIGGPLGLADAVDRNSAERSSAGAPLPRGSGRGPSTSSSTSASESFRTWRARPPSISGGYSQERMRTRVKVEGAARG